MHSQMGPAKSFSRVALWALSLPLAFVLIAHAAVTPLGPGTAAPTWKELPGIDGAKHSLADLDDAKVVVVAFTCNTCPFAQSYEERFSTFAKKYADRGVEFVAINCNLDEDDLLPAMKERAKAQGFAFPYLHDASQSVGRAFGAKVTPHLYVLDKDRKIAYVGSFDDARKPERVTKEYVVDAVEALLSGKEVPVAKTRATGCSIRYE
ncbi:thiol-disulfide oxidoreductase [Planctomycetes bacterium Pan216]|uniref:Thiol-disulfide oxidoreductase n=1 Tax=Kolteria novifilia TaxID=2527975 RepID=A0A518B2C6_9BACT|nr:thiol-disulfide oxidoreductase [Planctomycetes bacterium Pan216]